MGMAMTMREYLERHGVTYQELKHPREVTASRIAQKAHVPGDAVAKAVLLCAESGYKLAVLPSTCKADLARLSHIFHERVGLATEQEIDRTFTDCDQGALPPLGQPYGVPVCVDDALYERPEIYFDAGDHETLVHVSGTDFRRLMADAMHGRFSHHM